MNAGQQVVRQERFQTEIHVQILVLIFGFEQAADDENRDVGVETADRPNELGAGHAGHDVIGDDQIDGGRVLLVAKLLQSALRAENCDHEEASALENRLPCGGLHRVVVDQQDG